MKKIAIVTACRTNNIGTDIQALAMQHIFSKYADTEIVNYKCTKLERSHRLLLKISLRDLFWIPYKMFKNVTHYSFRKKHFHFSKEKYDPSNLHMIKNAYDAMVVGSDQVWNLNITGNDLNFFLPFKNSNAKKYAYAPSFGVADISAWQQTYNLAELLKDFEGVSTREQSGVNALKEIGISATEKLDPILAVDASLWRSFYKPTKRRKPYILVYSIGGDKALYQAAIDYAKAQKWDVIFAVPPTKPRSYIKIKSFISIPKWISLVQDAEMVVTNSYHGLSFCIANKKNFRLTMLSNKEQNIRSLLLLEKLHLQNYTMENKNFEDNPDWQSVNALLEEFRLDADVFVREICH